MQTRISTLLLATMLFPSALISTESARSELWSKVWELKGQHAAHEGNSTHEADGYDLISQTKWQAMVERLLSKAAIKPHARICEFGCGAGALLKVVEESYPQSDLWGFDYSDSLIELAKRQLPHAHLWVQNIQDPLPMEVSAGFDLTICHGVFIYLDSLEKVKEVLRRMAQITRAGGTLLLGDISDEAKRALAEQLRTQTHSSSKQVAPGLKLDHLYIPRELFSQIAQELSATIEFIEYSEIDPQGNYPNGPYRYCVLITLAK